MISFRIGTLGPLWLEEFVFFVADETRRLPARAASTTAAAARLTRTLMERGIAAARPAIANPMPKATSELVQRPAVREAELLDEPLEWSLATEQLVATGSGAAAAVALHAEAAEQLDALTYSLDRLREELRPLMTYAPIGGDAVVHRLEKPAPSLEALLELARQNAKTRPPERTLTAA
jgi:hypothetical protein